MTAQATETDEVCSVTIIEDLEYLGGSVFSSMAGPLCFDCCGFGIEENSRLLIPYVGPELYDTFKEDVTNYRENYQFPGDSGFKISQRAVARSELDEIEQLAQEMQDLTDIEPEDDRPTVISKTRGADHADNGQEFRDYQEQLKETISEKILS